MLAGLKRGYRLIVTVVALSAGAIVLLSLIFESEVLRLLRAVFVEWTVIIVAFALLLGVLNVLRVHGQRIQARRQVVYSVILVCAFLVVFIPGILSRGVVPETFEEWVGAEGSIVSFCAQYILRPLQATFFSLMAFFVVTAAWRAFRVRSVASFLMSLTALLVLLGSIRFSVGGDWGLLVEAKNWLMSVPVMAGSRGILLGIVLGSIVTGFRLLVGIDRPYSD